MLRKYIWIVFVTQITHNLFHLFRFYVMLLKSIEWHPLSWAVIATTNFRLDSLFRYLDFLKICDSKYSNLVNFCRSETVICGVGTNKLSKSSFLPSAELLITFVEFVTRNRAASFIFIFGKRGKIHHLTVTYFCTWQNGREKVVHNWPLSVYRPPPLEAYTFSLSSLFEVQCREPASVLSLYTLAD